MSESYERDLEDVVDALQRAKVRSKTTTLIVGAGCSQTAGIPLAGEFCTIIEKRFKQVYNRIGTYDYQRLMAALAPGERRDLLVDHIDEAKINWAHMGIAKLMKEGYVDRVITPNFDPLIVQACALLNLFPAVYDLAASETFKPDFVPSPAVYYIHGQRSGFRLLNTERELQAHTKRLQPVFEEADGRLCIVVGYSGLNDPVFDQLLSRQAFDYALYWVGYRDNDPPSHLTGGFLDEEHHRFYVRGEDADSFFTRVTSALGHFPPDLVRRPFTHLLNTLSMVEDYEMEQDGVHIDLLESARNMANRAVETIENQEDESEDKLTKARGLLMSEHYDEVLALVGEEEDPRLHDLAYRARTSKGAGFAKAARLGENEADRQLLFEQAIEQYTAALRIKPEGHQALYNWGNVLFDQARRTENNEDAFALFEQAIEKYDAAVGLKPDMYQALNNWGTILLEQGRRTEEDENALMLFEQAVGKYDAAVELKPGMYQALNNWGNALLEQGRCTEDNQAAIALFNQAIEKYDAVVGLKPDYHVALDNWGSALLYQGRRTEDNKTAIVLFDQAIEKYRAAVELKPDMHKALNNWGSALFEQGRRTESYHAALALFDQAIDRYAAAVEAQPEDHMAIDNWGSVLFEQARRTEDNQAAIALFDQAIEKYRAAVELKPDKHKALNNWGIALSEQAKRTEDAKAAIALFDKATEKYAAAVKIQPDAYIALDNWGNTLLQQAARSSSQEEHRARAEDAVSVLERALELDEDAAAYNYACAMARLDRPADAERWLRHSRAAGTLPSCEHLRDDVDLDSIREDAWFIAFMDEVCGKS